MLSSEVWGVTSYRGQSIFLSLCGLVSVIRASHMAIGKCPLSPVFLPNPSRAALSSGALLQCMPFVADWLTFYVLSYASLFILFNTLCQNGKCDNTRYIPLQARNRQYDNHTVY